MTTEDPDWQATGAEDDMADDSSDIDQPSVVDAAIAQWFQELDRGTAPSQSEFIARFPHLTQQLTEFFADFNRFSAHQPARPVEADSSESASSAIDPSRTPTQLQTSDSERVVDEAFLTVSVRYFGDYELVREIARGGMGIVYEARQRSLNRPVALKMILAGRLATAAEVARFRREAEAAARLEHPGIVPIHEIGQHGDQHYFTMGLVDGQSLSAKLQERPLLPREAALLVRDVAIAVQFAHSRGVVHRDLKPSNILLGTSSGNSPGELPYSPRVTDFGLAKLARTDQSLTETGQILGTPSYMPPEQAAGLTDEIGPAADIYALGAVLYACLTGRPPFQSASALDTVKQVLERDPVSLRELDSTIPKDLETICLKCLEKSIPRRYATAQDVADELQRFLDGRPILARPVTSLERMGRWCRRNPLVASLSAAVALSLLAGIAVSSYLAWEKNQLAIRERNAKKRVPDPDPDRDRSAPRTGATQWNHGSGLEGRSHPEGRGRGVGAKSTRIGEDRTATGGKTPAVTLPRRLGQAPGTRRAAPDRRNGQDPRTSYPASRAVRSSRIRLVLLVGSAG